jgi:hypothetical protein
MTVQNTRSSLAIERTSQSRTVRDYGFSREPVVLEKRPREANATDFQPVRLERAKHAKNDKEHDINEDDDGDDYERYDDHRVVGKAGDDHDDGGGDDEDDDDIPPPPDAPDNNTQQEAQRATTMDEQPTVPDERQVETLLSRYIARVLKRVAPGTQLSNSCVRIAATELQAVAKLIAAEATRLAEDKGHDKVSSREVQAALFLALPEQLALEAVKMGRDDLKRREAGRSGNRMER